MCGFISSRVLSHTSYHFCFQLVLFLTVTDTSLTKPMEPNQHEISTQMGALFSSPPPLHSSRHDWSHSSEVIEEEEGNCSNETSPPNKLCARGHWRPAEDAKLRELVSQFGPQNWNLIAEKLEGRSGWFFNLLLILYLCHNTCIIYMKVCFFFVVLNVGRENEKGKVFSQFIVRIFF